ncbi:glycosyltransferase [Acinetobacter pittii]|uniref:glycosyltransferase n=1 Tax=Acinetobacter pittii TaxID=48296 RepID=UPI003008EE29
MKIVYVITQFGIGGAERVLMNLANEMKKNGHEIHIVSLLPMSGMETNAIDIQFLDFKRNFFKSFIALRHLIKHLAPDVVHSHCLHANVITRLLRTITPMKKLISSAHSSNEGEGIFMKIYKYTNFLADINTNVSDAAVKKYINNNYIRKKDIRRVYNVIDILSYNFCEISRDKYRKNLELENTTVLISVGTLKEAKDYPTLIKAISILKEKGIHNFKQFIVGNGPLDSELKKMVSTYGLENEIIFLGGKSDIKELLSMADIFVLSSKFEGLPTVLVEAIMAENIVVSTKCEGVDEILRDSAFLTNISDCNELALSIEKAINFLGSQEKNNYLKFQKEYVKENFSKENIFQQWLDIYEK